MSDKYFNYSEVLSYGWNVMKADLGFFVGLGLIFLVITYIPNIIFFIAAFLYMLIMTCIPALMDVIGTHPYLSSLVLVALKLAITILDLVISIVLGIGLIKIALKFLR